MSMQRTDTATSLIDGQVDVLGEQNAHDQHNATAATDKSKNITSWECADTTLVRGKKRSKRRSKGTVMNATTV